MTWYKLFLLSILTILTMCNEYLYSQIVVIVNKNNSIESLNINDLKRIYLGESIRWEENNHNGNEIILIDFRKNMKTANKFFNSVTGLSQSRVRLAWMNKMLNGEFQNLPVKLTSDAECIEYISKHPNAIGFINADSFNPETNKVKAIRINSKTFYDEDYPIK